MNYRVQIVCTEPSHEGRTAKVALFQGSTRTGSEWQRLFAGESDEDRLLHVSWVGMPSHQNMTCRLCTLKVSARTTTVSAAFDRLAEAGLLKEDGLASFELRHLRAILS